MLSAIQAVQVIAVATVAVLAFAVPVWPCTAHVIAAPQELVSEAEVIVRVKAGGYALTSWRETNDIRKQTLIEFTILEVLKGEISTRTISFYGTPDDRDDPNDQPVPYKFARPAGRGGNCIATAYRPGAEYLLFLSRRRNLASYGGPDRYLAPRVLTPYWARLAPTNEQLSEGSEDPWLLWVVAEIHRTSAR